MGKALANKVLSPQFRAELARVIGPHNRKAHDRKGGVKRDCSSATRDDRASILLRAFAELGELGYKLKSPKGLKEKHLEALAAHWKEKNLAAQTIHKRFSALRVFASWIGKKGMVRDLDDYFPQREGVKRTSIANQNRAWEAGREVKIKDVLAKATTLDERFGLYLTLQHVFGLRVKESINWRPLHTTCDEAYIEVSEGTKGGRPRLIPVRTQEERDVVAWAKRVAMASRSDRIRWPGRTWLQCQHRFYNMMRAIGATKAGLGITAHGLRHGNLQQQYRKETGRASPIEGGVANEIDWQTHRLAAIKVAVRAGHNRSSVLGYYCGSYGHSLRASIPAFTAGETNGWIVTGHVPKGSSP